MTCLPRDGYRCLLAGLVVGLLSMHPATTARAQMLRGEWVDQAERSIDQHRKSNLEVIVLDRQDRAVANARVRITQTRHAFELGLTVPAQGDPPASARQQPLYRCFNALALDQVTRWVSPNRHWPKPARDHIDRWAQAFDPIQMSFGTVIASDPAVNFDGLAKLETAVVAELLRQRVDAALELDPRIGRYDLYRDTTGPADLREEIGFGLIHRLFDQAHAIDHDAGRSIRLVNGLDTLSSRQIVQRARSYQLRLVPLSGITIEQHFTGQVLAPALSRTLRDRVGALPVPVTLADLEVGGDSQVAAAINLETVLRLLFAQPNIEAVYLAGLTETQTLESHAALINEDGSLTASGQLIDDLFGKHWWSEVEGETDGRGNLQTRVFKGWYEIEAVLPDGTVLRSRAYVDVAEGEKHTVVLQQTTIDG